jgi:hypothetical protein
MKSILVRQCARAAGAPNAGDGVPHIVIEVLFGLVAAELVRIAEKRRIADRGILPGFRGVILLSGLPITLPRIPIHFGSPVVTF